MATATYATVDTGGTGDYSSLAAAEAGEQKDLVAADEQLTITCQCTGGDADTSPVTFSGWTVDATRYIKVWTDPAESYRHDGKWNDNKYRLAKTLNYDYINFLQCKIVEGLQCTCTTASVTVVAPSVLIDSCIIKAALQPAVNGIIQNCLFLYDGYSTYGIYNSWRGTQYCYNCTFIGVTGTAIYINTGNNACSTKNCLFYDCAADYYQSTATGKTQKNCATDNDDTDSGLLSTETTHRFEQTFSFVGSGDYHLVSTDAGAKGYGENLSATFTNDIDGSTRPSSGAWCIGMDEYIAAAGKAIYQHMLKPIFNHLLAR